MTLIWLCCGWLVGIVAADTLGLPLLPALFGAGMCGLLALLWRRSSAVLLFAILAALALGAARDAVSRPITDASAVWWYTGGRVVVTGTVTRQPDWSDDDQVVVIAAERLAQSDNTQVVHGLVRLHLGSLPELRYGQQVEARGVLLRPRSDASFDFGEYLARHSIYALMEHPRVQVVAQARTTPASVLLKLNDHVREVLERSLPEPHAGLLVGMLLGAPLAISEDVVQDFRATGTSHMLVISGWNITVLVAAVIGILVALGLSRRSAAALSLPVLIAYVLFVGASPSVLRAGVMGGLVVWAELADREADFWTGLLLACALLALLDPNVLWDVGFQLSALGTAGVLAWSKPIRDFLTAWPWLKSRAFSAPVEALAATLAALVLLLPLQLYRFGTLSLIAPLANVLLAPAVPFAMLTGLCATLTALIALPLGQIAGLLVWPFTAWLIDGAHLLAALPFAAVVVPPFGAGWLWAWYACIGGMSFWYARSRPATL